MMEGKTIFIEAPETVWWLDLTAEMDLSPDFCDQPDPDHYLNNPTQHFSNQQDPTQSDTNSTTMYFRYRKMRHTGSRNYISNA